jgi:DNA-binding MarR family transcriptional regulator
MTVGRKSRLRVLRGYDVPEEGRGRAVLLTLIRVFGRMNEATARLVKQHDLTLPHFEVLLCLKAGEGISQQELSERLLLTKGNICIIMQKMESSGLIERRPDPTDQRFHRLYLTDTGRRLLAKVMPDHHALMGKILSGLSQAEQKTLHELLSRIDQTFDDLEL